MDRIARLRTRYEDDLMRIDGVVGVGSVIDAEGVARLRVLTSVPPEEVRPKLPDAVRSEAVVVHVGEIDAHAPN